MRRVGAFLVAPFPVAFFQSVVVALWPKEGMGVFENPPSMFAAMCIYFYSFGLLLGIPAWLILRRRKASGSQAFAIAGLIAGLLPIGLALGWTTIQEGSTAYVAAYNLLLFGVGGLVAGWTFRKLSQRSPATV